MLSQAAMPVVFVLRETISGGLMAGKRAKVL